jgi:anti-sigma factor RsiW
MIRRLLARRRELVCRDAVEMVNDYLEGTLPSRDRRRLEIHLADCPHCTAFLEQIRTTVRLTERLVPEDLSDHLQDEFIEIFRKWHSEDASS